jgi:hypothetical protein
MARFGRAAAHAVPLTVGALLLATGVSAAQPSTVDAANARTEAGISALQGIKKSLTPTERKQSSQLVVEKRLRADHSLAAKLPEYHSGVGVSNTGTVSVDITAQGTAVVKAIKTAGGIVRFASPEGLVRADLPLSAVDVIAGRTDVTAVESAGRAMNGNEPAGRQAHLATAAGLAAATRVSEGDKAHGADTARKTYGVSGSGVKVCVLSDGVDSLAKSQSAGELPAVDVLSGQQGEGDEGTAMLEIVHDLAPNATLGFANANTSEASFAANLRALHTTSKCQIIVDDVFYLDESPFQDTQVAQAINDVTAAGALYFTSAGNAGNATDGTSGHYEGDFRSSSTAIAGITGTPHDFDSGSATQNFDPFVPSSYPVTLFWSDPWGKSSNDYDLFVMDSSGNVVGSGANDQTGTQNPFESVDVPTTGSGFRVAVVKFRGADRYIAVNTNRGRFVTSGALKAFSTSGALTGHKSALNAFGVAAAPAAAAFQSGAPVGPFPGVFTTSSKWEQFSSDGQRHMFYKADGTEFTPGNVSSTGGVTRSKPDITAADGVTTSVTGFQPFYGTSAAAPHAAAIAALLLSGKPTATPAQIRSALVSSAIDLGAPGFGTVSGNGIVMPGPALAALGVQPK